MHLQGAWFSGLRAEGGDEAPMETWQNKGDLSCTWSHFVSGGE